MDEELGCPNEEQPEDSAEDEEEIDVLELDGRHCAGERWWRR